MIRSITLLSLFVFLSGCSLFGDSLRDRSLDYRVYQQESPAKGLDGKPLSDGRQDPYPLSGSSVLASTSDEFVVPKPEPLVMESLASNKSVSLAEYRSTAINPRLLTDGAGSRLLQLSAGYGNAWALVAEALVKADYKVTDLNRDLGVYYVEVENPEGQQMSWWSRLWADSEDYENHIYLLKMSPNTEGVYLSLLRDMDELAEPEIVDKVLSELKVQLEK